MRYSSIVAVLAATAPCGATHEWRQIDGLNTSTGGPCVAPGHCTPYDAKYKKVLSLLPRTQWNIAGGFCGAMSIQSGALAFGAWISQDLVRKANTHGEGHGSKSEGYEVLPSNVGQTARHLKLLNDEWDYENTTKPQAPAYKAWLKKHLTSGHPVVWFVMCKGDGVCPYSPASKTCPNGGSFGHIEAVWGIGSNHPLTDKTVYDDDWVLHGSDQDKNPYYRRFSSLEDTTKMNGNCAKAQPGFGKNEMYPCINDQTDYGLAITGVKTPGALPIVLDIGRQDEPDIREHSKAAELTGKVTVSGLTSGKSYILYRYGSTAALPTSTDMSGYESKTPFTATADTWKHEDPKTFLSSSATYYVAVAA